MRKLRPLAALALRRPCRVDQRSTHPVEDVHLAGQPIGKAKAEHAVADDGGLSRE